MTTTSCKPAYLLGVLTLALSLPVLARDAEIVLLPDATVVEGKRYNTPAEAFAVAMKKDKAGEAPDVLLLRACANTPVENIGAILQLIDKQKPKATHFTTLEGEQGCPPKPEDPAAEKTAAKTTGADAKVADSKGADTKAADPKCPDVAAPKAKKSSDSKAK